MGAIAGTVEFASAGKQWALKGEVVVSPFQTEKEMLSGPNGPVGHKVTRVSPGIKAKLATPRGFALKFFEELEDDVVSAKLANGTQYTLEGAIVVGRPEISSDEGEVDVEWQGLTMTETTT